MTDERPIRRAASVIAARPGPDGPEILILRRSVTSRFLPGYVVFPGGAVDEDDAALAERWFGRETEAARAAGVRELIEEVGVALTSTGMVVAGRSDPLGSTDADPPSVAQLPEVAHWVAPQDVPVRFDARFFAVAAPLGLEPAPDGVEAEHAWWEGPRSLMEGWAKGEHSLYWPTYFTMLHLAACSAVDDVLALRLDTREPEESEIGPLPSSVFGEG